MAFIGALCSMNENDIAQLWSRVSAQVFGELDEHTRDLWVTPITPRAVNDQSLVLSIPNKYFSDWLETNGYARRIEQILAAEMGGPRALSYEYSFNLDEVRTNDTPDTTTFEYLPEKVFLMSWGFNPNYTFDDFITDESNRFAKAICEGCAQTPGSRYNPVFIYSPAGLGKTHLLHAFGNKMLQLSKGFRIAYISADRFISDYVGAIKDHRLDTFRSKFQNSVALLLDDVHFLAGKEGSSEEFFHVFNMMFDARKQIIITSDRKPQDLKDGFQDRLISRFEWGVIADIGQPSMELRLAILRHKAQKQQVYVPDDVLRFLAENISENIRRLEGALIRMIAKSLTENIPLTIDNVRTMLKDMIDPTPRTVSIERIIAALEEEFRIPRRELLSRKRSSQLALARQFGMYLAKMLTDLPYLAISEHFGRRDHTTAYHAYLKIKNLIDTNPYYAQLVNNLTKKVRP